MTQQAKFGMTEGELERIHDDDLRRLTLSRFSKGEVPLFLDSRTRHILPKPDALALCGQWRCTNKRTLIDISLTFFFLIQKDNARGKEACVKCVTVIEEALK
jgi:hypothetical protein